MIVCSSFTWIRLNENVLSDRMLVEILSQQMNGFNRLAKANIFEMLEMKTLNPFAKS
jgi:hypothetical protein